MKKLTALLSIILLFMAACQTDRQAEMTGERSLRVMHDEVNSFFNSYGSAFMLDYPNVSVDMISAQANSSIFDIESALEHRKPDVIKIGPEAFQYLVEQGKLYPLDTLIEEDDFDLEGFHPAVMQLVKQWGFDRIYGLAPFFDSYALYYNVEMFEEYGVPHPHDNMTWQEILQLAQRFSTAEGVHGFFSNEFKQPLTLLDVIGQTIGLQKVDGSGQFITYDTVGWRSVWEMVKPAVLSGAVYIEPIDKESSDGGNMLRDQLFAMGQAAMSLDTYKLNIRMNTVQTYVDDAEEFDWQLVTAPVDPSNRTKSAFFGVSEIYAVNADSELPELAWEIIKFINGKEKAEELSESTVRLLSRTEFIKEWEGRDMEVFYKMEPADRLIVTDSGLANSFLATLNTSIAREFNLYLQDEKSVEEALQTVQAEGQEALDQYLNQGGEEK